MPVPIPAGMNPLQAFLYRAKNDPNFARALQVGGLALLNSGKDESTIRSFARAGMQGMQTMQQGREREQATATQAEDKTWKRQQEERRTAAKEKRTADQVEANRREIELRLKDLEGNDAARKSEAEYRLKSLANQELELKLRRQQEGKSTAADREADQYSNYVKEEAAKRGVQLTEANAYILGQKYKKELEAGGKSGVNQSQMFNSVFGTMAGNADFGADLAPIAEQAAATTQKAGQVLQGSAVNPDESLSAQLQQLRTQQQPGPTKAKAAAMSSGTNFTDDAGVQYTIAAETPAGIILKYSTPDGRTGTIVRSAQEVAAFRK